MTRHGKSTAISPAPIAGTSSSGNPESIITGTTQGTGDLQANEDFAGETVHQIEAMVESFRTGKTKKSQAVFKIGQILATDPRGNDELKSDSIDRYASTLDGIEAQAAQSDKHGANFTNPILGKRKDEPNRGSQRHDEFR